MKKLLLSMGSLVFVGAILAGGTGAFLYDNGSSTGNTFASGVVDLKVDNESYITDALGHLALSAPTTWSLSDLTGKLFYNFSDIKPGDIGEDTVSVHVNNNNAWACMNIKQTSTPENGTSTPEALVDTTQTANAGELQNYLYFVFWADDGDNVYEKGEKIFKQGLTKDIFTGANWTLADSASNIWDGTGPMLGDTTKYIGEAWCFGNITAAPINQDNHGKTGSNGPLARGTGFSCDGSGVGNVVQSDGIKADVSFSVEQSRNNNSFSCSTGTTTTPPPVNVSTSTLFFDNFNGCTKGKEFSKLDDPLWDELGGVQGDDWGPPQGKLAFLNAGTKSSGPNHTASITSSSFSTTGFHNIVLKYDRNIDAPAGAPMTLTVDYSVNGGSTWTTLETTGTDSDTTTKTFSLSPSADNKAAVKVRFTLVGTNSSDHVYIDNVTVTGQTP
jgi:hypothetical protein